MRARNMNAERSAVVTELKRRVGANISNTIEERDCVALCLAASLPRDREEVFGVLLNNNLSRVAMQCADSLKVTDLEWSKLFGKSATFTSEAKSATVIREPEFAVYCDALENALRCSLLEPASKVAWKGAVARLSCYVALYTDSSEEFVSHILGGLVRSDMRRLDDVRSNVEDQPTDHMLLCQALLALSHSVCC